MNRYSWWFFVDLFLILFLDLVDQIPDELYEMKEVIEKFMVLEKTRGRGRDRGGVYVDLYDGELLNEIGDLDMNDEDDEATANRLSRSNRNHKEDAFADDEADLLNGVSLVNCTVYLSDCLVVD